MRCHPTLLALEALPWGTGGGGRAGGVLGGGARGGPHPPGSGRAPDSHPQRHTRGSEIGCVPQKQELEFDERMEFPRPHSKNRLPTDLVLATVEQGGKDRYQSHSNETSPPLAGFHLPRLEACGRTACFSRRCQH